MRKWSEPVDSSPCLHSHPVKGKINLSDERWHPSYNCMSHIQHHCGLSSHDPDNTHTREWINVSVEKPLKPAKRVSLCSLFASQCQQEVTNNYALYYRRHTRNLLANYKDLLIYLWFDAISATKVIFMTKSTVFQLFQLQYHFNTLLTQR